MTQTIYRPARRIQFTMVSNAIMNDESLSAEAIGVLVYLLSRPDDWNIQIEQLKKRFNIGRDKMQAIMRELSDAGHARLEALPGAEPGQFAGKRWVIIEEPATESRQPENPVVGGGDAESLKNRQSGKPTVGKPGCIPNTELRPNTDSETNIPPTPQGGGSGKERSCGKVTAETSGLTTSPLGRFEEAWEWGKYEDRQAAAREFFHLTPDEQEAAIRGISDLKAGMRGREHPIHAKTYLRNRSWRRQPAKAASTPSAKPLVWIPRQSLNFEAWQEWHAINGGATMAREANGTKRLIASQRGEDYGIWRQTEWPPGHRQAMPIAAGDGQAARA